MDTLEILNKAIGKLNEDIQLVEEELFNYCERYWDEKIDVLKFTDSVNLLQKRLERYEECRNVLINKRQELKSFLEN